MKKLQSIVLSTILSSTLLQANNLDKVIVTAKTKQSVETTAGSITVITQEQISKMHVSSIQDVLLETVGINISVDNNTSTGRGGISIRGARSKHTLILVDGKRVSGSDSQIPFSDFQYNWVPINMISKIEIIRGPMSSIYGSNAIGGVINIITKKSNKKIHGGISLLGANSSADGGNERDVSFNLGGTIAEKLTLSLAAEIKETKTTFNAKSYIKPANPRFGTPAQAIDAGETVIREGKKVKNLILDLEYNLDDTSSISLSYLKGREDRIRKDDDVYERINRDNYSLAYKKNFSDITMDMKYYATNVKDRNNTSKYFHKVEDRTFSLDFQIDSFDNHFVTTGLEYRTESYKKPYDDGRTLFSDKISYKSIFVQDEIEINDALILTLGSRYDKHERFGSEISPKANIVYSINENHKLKASYGHGFNAPSLTQNSSKYVVPAGPTRTYRGNDDLQAETSDTFEIGYEFYKGNTSFKSAIFHTKFNNLINTNEERTPSGHTNVVYRNVVEAKVQGLELEYAQKELFENLDFSILYDYLRSQNTKTKKRLLRRAKQNIKMKLSYALPYGIESNFRLNYTGSELYEYGTMGSSDIEVGGYTTYGIQFSKEFIKGLSAKIGVENLGNKILSDTSAYNIKGRLIYLGLNYTF